MLKPINIIFFIILSLYSLDVLSSAPATIPGQKTYSSSRINSMSFFEYFGWYFAQKKSIIKEFKAELQIIRAQNLNKEEIKKDRIEYIKNLWDMYRFHWNYTWLDYLLNPFGVKCSQDETAQKQMVTDFFKQEKIKEIKLYIYIHTDRYSNDPRHDHTNSNQELIKELFQYTTQGETSRPSRPTDLVVVHLGMVVIRQLLREPLILLDNLFPGIFGQRRTLEKVTLPIRHKIEDYNNNIKMASNAEKTKTAIVEHKRKQLQFAAECYRHENRLKEH